MKHLKSFNEKIGENDTFTFLTLAYDVSKAWQMIQANPEKYKSEDDEFNTITLATCADFFGGAFEKDGKKFIRMGVKIDQTYANSLTDAELNEPGIFINDSKKGFNFLIDGWHRAFALYNKGVETMKVWTISDPKDIRKITLR